MSDAAVNAVAHAVFNHFNSFGRIFPCEEFGADFETFTTTRGGVRSIVNAAGTRCLHQETAQKRTIGFNAGRLELRHKPVAILVDDQSGKPVGFAENQANCVRTVPERLAKENGFPHLPLKPRVINDFIFAIGPAACSQRGRGRICRPGKETPVARKHSNRISRHGLSDHTLNCGVIYPGMPAKKGLLLALFQNKV